MLLQKYFYFNGIPYEQLPFGKQTKIDRLIENMKLDHQYEKIFLYQDHYFNIQDSEDHNSHEKQFHTDLPDDLTKELIRAYLKTIDPFIAVNN
jgi:hypothetical protein